MLPHLTALCLRTLMALITLTLASGCAESKELTRSRAADLIKKRKRVQGTRGCQAEG
jgi:hypothetical protein